jgi:hypothetical protein
VKEYIGDGIWAEVEANNLKLTIARQTDVIVPVDALAAFALARYIITSSIATGVKLFPKEDGDVTDNTDNYPKKSWD